LDDDKLFQKREKEEWCVSPLSKKKEEEDGRL
jgi:hypothetical protein